MPERDVEISGTEWVPPASDGRRARCDDRKESRLRSPAEESVRQSACKCETCGKSFEALWTEVKRGKGRFCSRTCVRRPNVKPPQLKSRPGTDVEKVRAHGLINQRIKRGRLQRPDKCDDCGKPCKPDAHHESYQNPDQVEWLCRSCHMKRHHAS